MSTPENLIDLTNDDDDNDDPVPPPPPSPPPAAESVADLLTRATAQAIAERAAEAVARAVAAVAEEDGEDGEEGGGEEEEDDEDFEDLDDRLERVDHELRALRVAVDRLTDREETQRHEVEMLRLQVRRANAERIAARAGERSRRDAAFFDGVRRRFVESWPAALSAMQDMPPQQLLFLGHLLDLPVVAGTGKLE